MLPKTCAWSGLQHAHEQDRIVADCRQPCVCPCTHADSTAVACKAATNKTCLLSAPPLLARLVLLPLLLSQGWNAATCVVEVSPVAAFDARVRNAAISAAALAIRRMPASRGTCVHAARIQRVSSSLGGETTRPRNHSAHPHSFASRNEPNTTSADRRKQR
eukprot:364100-Chlamydomonas_euryale.AAC.59